MACSPLGANWSDPFFRRCRCSPTFRSTYLRSKKIPLVTSSTFTKSKPKTLQGSVEHLSSNYHYLIRNWGKILLQGLFQCIITNFMTLHREQLILLLFVSKVHRYKHDSSYNDSLILACIQTHKAKMIQPICSTRARNMDTSLSYSFTHFN